MNINILRYGKPEDLPEVRHLRAGPLTLFYEAGDLRYIKLADKEIIRRLYVAVRDQNWGTVAGLIRNEQIKQTEDSFEIRYESVHEQNEIKFIWNALIRGDASGTIVFEMNGEALSTFLRNRIGFCVLHPLRECRGVKATIEHVDGSSSPEPFPVEVAPQRVVNGIIQPVHPFSEMRSLRYAVTPEVRAEIAFSGDIFEMEDQRNWIDASYKTYCTPLRLPWPVEIKKGDKVRQSVSLKLHGALPKVEPDASTSVIISISDDKTKLPKMGLCVASHGESLSERELERLRTLNLSHLRVDLNLAEDYQDTLGQAIKEAKRLNVKLELALLLSDNAETELTTIAKQLHEAPVLDVLIFHLAELCTSEPWLRLARDIFKAHNVIAPIYGGSNAYFTHINAEKPPVDLLDGAVYSINPQVHAFDNSSIAETCEAIISTIQTAKTFVGNKPLAISTATLKPRYNPYDRTKHIPSPDELPPQVDVRQLSLFGATWTLGSLKYMTESNGLESVTFYETTGWRGVMEKERGSPLPEKFPSTPGAVFPLYHVFASVAEFMGGEGVRSSSSHPLKVESFVLRKGEKQRVLLANMTNENQTVRLEQKNAFYIILDETNAEEAMTNPETFRAEQGKAWTGELTLLPYALVLVDSQRRV
jgi:D-apionolactonase